MIPVASKPSADRTFVVAASVLGLVAVVQLAAAAFALAPQLRFESTSVPVTGEQTPARTSGLSAPTAEASQEQIEMVNNLLARAEEAAESGDLAASLELLNQADQIVPNEPVTTLQIGRIHGALGNRIEAAAAFEKALIYSTGSTLPVHAVVREEAQALLESLRGGGSPASAQSGSGAGSSSGAPAQSMRDEVGIPIGSVMGIVDSRIVEEEPGFMNLRVATKTSPAEQIVPESLKVVVFFYEQNERGEVVPTTSSLMPEWLSPPIDWGNAEPELLNIKYPKPAIDRDGMSSLEYYGYVLGIYYNGELQDSRAEPVGLLEEFPLQLTIREDM